MNDDIAVVGASLAGVHAARQLRREGFAGRVVVFGAEPHAPYDRPPLSKQILRGEWAPEKTTLRRHEHDDGIEWRLGTCVDALDAATLTLTTDGQPERFEGGIVLATGAVPRRLPGTPAGGVHVLRTLDDSLALAAELAAGPAHVVVVGGGFIGGEVASSARHHGLDVTMVEMTQVPFAAALGAEVGAALADLHRAHGVHVLGGARVVRLHGSDRVEAVELDTGETLPADVVVLGLGVVPNTGWLEGSGLQLDDGVVCDETLLAAPRIVAAGDLARWPDASGELHRVEHWDNAVRQGRYAATRLVAGEAVAPYAAVPWMWSDQYDVKLHVYGSTRSHDEVRIVDGSPAEGRFIALYRSGDRLAGALGINRVKRVMAYRALLEQGASWDAALEHALAAA